MCLASWQRNYSKIKSSSKQYAEVVTLKSRENEPTLAEILMQNMFFLKYRFWQAPHLHSFLKRVVYKVGMTHGYTGHEAEKDNLRKEGEPSSHPKVATPSAHTTHNCFFHNSPASSLIYGSLQIPIWPKLVYGLTSLGHFVSKCRHTPPAFTHLWRAS